MIPTFDAGRMLLDHGECGGSQILSPASIELMMTDHLTPEQKSLSLFFPGFWESNGGGFGGAITTRRDPSGPSPGSYGWTGGFSTAFTIDPAKPMVAISLTQRQMRGPDDTAIYRDFLALAYRAIGN